MQNSTVTRSQLLQTVRKNYPELQGLDDNSAVQQILEQVPTLRHRVLDDQTGQPVWNGKTGEVLSFKAQSTAHDNNNKGTYSWKPEVVQQARPSEVTSSWEGLPEFFQQPRTYAQSPGTSVETPQSRVEPIQSPIPGLAPYRSGQDLPSRPFPRQELGQNPVTQVSAQSSRVEPIQSPLPGLADYRSGRDIPARPFAQPSPQQANVAQNPPQQARALPQSQPSYMPAPQEQPQVQNVPTQAPPPAYREQQQQAIQPDLARVQQIRDTQRQELLAQTDLQNSTQAGLDRPMPTQMRPAMNLTADAERPDLATDPRLNEAKQLEAQAAPRPGPHGFQQNLVAGLSAGLTAFANPRNYQEIELQKQQMERQRQQDLFGRAKELRGEAAAQQDRMLRLRQVSGEEEYRRQNLAADQAYKAQNFASEDAYRKAQIKKLQEPDFKYIGSAQGGGFYGSVDNGQFTKQGEIAPAPPTARATPAGELEFGDYMKHPELTSKFGADRVGFGRFQDDQMKQRQIAVANNTNQNINERSVMMVYDPAQGQNVPVHRNNAVGDGFTAPQPANVLQEARNTESSIYKLGKLEKSYSDEFVGPAMARWLAVKAALPQSVSGELPEGYGTFIQNQADLKNSVIKLITGAQMGKDEATRIMKQVPAETDRPEIWRAKFEQTKQNVAFMESLIQRQTGGTGAAPAGGGKIIVKDPNGKDHPFDTQAQADAFKKLAGIK